MFDADLFAISVLVSTFVFSLIFQFRALKKRFRMYSISFEISDPESEGKIESQKMKNYEAIFKEWEKRSIDTKFIAAALSYSVNKGKLNVKVVGRGSDGKDLADELKHELEPNIRAAGLYMENLTIDGEQIPLPPPVLPESF